MIRAPRQLLLLLLVALPAAWGCSSGNGGTNLSGLTPGTHGSFPILAAEHAADCLACHTDPNTFANFSCTGCHAHEQPAIDMVHVSVAPYAFSGTGCYQCHPSPTRQGFDHAGITGSCALCHTEGGSFAALPRAGFTHPATGGQDCGACHTTTSWSSGSMPSALVHDPAQDVAVTGLVPAYAATAITTVTPLAQTLEMDMDHASTAQAGVAMASCAGCHANAGTGAYYPGVLHASLTGLSLAQPATCASCHAGAAPVGFVGPTAAHPARSPASGEMKHDAVAWSGGARTTNRLVTADCAVCHAVPTAATGVTWATGRAGGAPTFHAALGAAGQAQPASCLDCHANTRPTALLTSATAALPTGVAFDHQAPSALGECASCHSASGAGLTSWAGGRFHPAGAATPTSCLPCHAGERPASAAGWASATYTASPFDYGTNAAGVTHGDGQDCARCHAGPGTGAWGGTQNWVGGHFAHGAGTPAASTCIACHSSQRPDLQAGTTPAAMATLLGFDHSLNGTGDCFGCHQATVTAGRYVNYVNPSTRTLPGGDWAGGTGYPGDQLVSAPNSAVTLTELTLTRSGTLVTGFTSATTTLYGGMTHVSAGIPAAVSPGPAANPDMGTCWHCHTNTNGTVTSYAGGRFHAALNAYSATPGGAVTPLPQPTAHCADCHSNMRPTGIVELSGSALVPMDHAALFTGSVTIGGITTSSAAGLDCSACHANPGVSFNDGRFHSRIGGAVPQDCTVCHYPLMASASADVASGTRWAMAHRSTQITVQRCDTCHASALSRATTTPVAATLWQTGAYHAGVAAQPSACLDCHASAAPAGATQGTVVYTLPKGGTGSNGAQWMSHRVAGVVGADCVTCHAADARASGAAWSRSSTYHAHVSSPGSCQACHGTSNGNGAVGGTGNNLPAGLTDSSTLTTASNDSTTGVPAGTPDQVVHTDVNVTGHDCSFCHTQVGPSTVAGVQGKEWAQAKFHVRFTTGAPLVMNGTTGRCSDCHMNVKPGASFAAQDHSAFTATSGTTDCATCHSWPGTGTSTTPNWLGGGGAPAFIVVGGFTIPNPPSNPPTVQAGIASLPHPSTATRSCATCHTGGVGGKRAIGYDHASTLASNACSACHEAGSNLVGTVWNGSTTQAGGLGDTRPNTITSLRATRGGDSCTLTNAAAAVNHFFPVDCSQCHNVPAGTGATTTGTTYTTVWDFPHTTSKMSNPSTCNICHNQPNCGK